MVNPGLMAWMPIRAALLMAVEAVTAKSSTQSATPLLGVLVAVALAERAATLQAALAAAVVVWIRTARHGHGSWTGRLKAEIMAALRLW